MEEFKYLLFKFIVVIFILVLFIALIGGICVSHLRGESPLPAVKVDTITVYVDSVRIVEHTKVKYVKLIDTFYVKQTADTIRDTVWLNELPIEHKTYSDTIENDSVKSLVNINYHGFAAEIDNISLFHNVTHQCTNVNQRKRFGWNISVGPYIGFGTDFRGVGPSVGVGVQFGWGYRIK